jgi:hypothetical protein
LVQGTILKHAIIVSGLHRASATPAAGAATCAAASPHEAAAPAPPGAGAAAI